MKGHPEELAVKLLKRFVEGWAPSLKKFCPRGMSYWMPSHLGGLGLPCIGTFTAKSIAGHVPKDRFSRSQLKLASYLLHDPDNQELLRSSSCISRSESISLWQLIGPEHKKLMESVPFDWVREETPRSSGEGSETSGLLMRAYCSLQSSDLEKTEGDDAEDRYLAWRNAYEKLFKQVEPMDIPILEEQVCATALPWKKVYRSYRVVDYTPTVDLSVRMEEMLTPRWSNPHLTRVSMELIAG